MADQMNKPVDIGLDFAPRYECNLSYDTDWYLFFWVS